MHKFKSIKRIVLTLLPGILICLAIMLLGSLVADLIGYTMIQMSILSEGSKTPISGIFVAILIGMIIRNTIGLNKIFDKGISFSTKYLLRMGIILLGLRLSLLEALRLGLMGVPLIIITISLGLFITIYLTRKMNQSFRLGALIACGTGICGVTAIMAISPIIDAKENEVSYAVANITIFGLIGMTLYPFLINYVFIEPTKIGMFLGTAIHDTAQVTGAALIYSEMFDLSRVIDVATVTKLTRNLFIIIVIPAISYLYIKFQTEESVKSKKDTLPKWYSFVPAFVIGFLALSLLRTIGDMTLFNSNKDVAFGLIESRIWEGIYTKASSFGTNYLMGMAMSGIGLLTDFKTFKGIGVKPFYIGCIAAMSVGMISLILVLLFGDYVVL